MRKVKIKKLPEAQSGLEVKMGTSGRGMIAGLGLNSNTMPWPVMAGQMAQPNIEVNKTLKPVAREGANLEAEKGETAFTDLVGDGIPQLYKIGGERHYDGGTPLNLPEDSFIFSRDNKMKIGGPILESFGKHKDTKDKFTPAELSAKYDVNEYRKILADPDSDKLQRDTAELMIANYNLKLAKLGLVQESKKGFPDGIPAISMPYIDVMQVDPNQFFQNPQGQGPQGMPDQPAADNVARYGKTLPKAQQGLDINAIRKSLEDNSTIVDTEAADDAAAAAAMRKFFTPDYNAQYREDLSDLENAINNDLRQYKFEKDIMVKKELKKNLDSMLTKYQAYSDYLKIPTKTATAAKQPTSTWTIDQYKKSLLDNKMPYATKKQSQLDFLRDNPMYNHAYRPKTGSPAYDDEQASKVQNNIVTTTPAIPATTGTSTNDLLAPAPAVQDTTGSAAANSLFKYGGNLPKAQQGKSVGTKPHPNGGTVSKYEDGTIVWTKADGSTLITQQGDPNWKPSATATGIQTNALATGKEPYTMAEAYGPIGVKRLNDFLEEYGLPKLALNATKAEIQKAVGDMQAKTIEANPDLVSHYMQNAVEPNNKLRAILKSKGYGTTKADLQKALKEGKITPEEIRGGYKDDQWWHRAVGTNQKVLTKEEYDKKMNDPNIIKQGDKIFTIEDPTKPEVYTEYITEDKKEETEPVIDKKEERIKQAVLGPQYKTPKPEWWLQDKVKMAGAFGDLMRIKKYPPWQATPGLAFTEGTFYDPTRELAANAEQVNLGVQGASTYTGPQSFAATAAALQGQGAANAANIMGRYNNMNVTESNRLGEQTAAILNQGAQQRAANATQLFDKQTIANQQFDNSKNMARQNLRQGYIDAITNRANTYNLNTLYPQFAVGPGSGGMVYNVPGSNRDANGNYKGQETPEEYLQRVHNMKGYDTEEKKWLRDQYPGATKSSEGYSPENLAKMKAMGLV